MDRSQLLAEAIPLAKRIAVFVGLSLIPFALVFVIMGSSIGGAVMTIVGQFILAVGTGIVLMYLIARGSQLAEE